MKIFQFTLILIALSSCTKFAKLRKDLKGEKWVIDSYTQSGYYNGVQVYSSTATNVGYLHFECKKRLVFVSMHAVLDVITYGPTKENIDVEKNCKYRLDKSKNENEVGQLLIWLSEQNVVTYTIKAKSNTEMVLTYLKEDGLGGLGVKREIKLHKEQ